MEVGHKADELRSLSGVDSDVSILVVMEVGHKAGVISASSLYGSEFQSLLSWKLVIKEDGHLRFCEAKIVSILVVMEVGHKALF